MLGLVVRDQVVMIWMIGLCEDSNTTTMTVSVVKSTVFVLTLPDQGYLPKTKYIDYTVFLARVL